MLSWLSKLCVWWCIIYRLKEYIPPIYTRDNGFESIAELLNVLSHGNLRVVATKEIPPSTEVVMDYHIQRSCFHASGTCATRESPAFQCFLKVFLISFAPFLICYTKKALLSRALCQVLILFPRYPQEPPHYRWLTCSLWGRSFVLRVRAPQTKRREL